MINSAYQSAASCYSIVSVVVVHSRLMVSCTLILVMLIFLKLDVDQYLSFSVFYSICVIYCNICRTYLSAAWRADSFTRYFLLCFID